jgi:hypothetical protein
MAGERTFTEGEAYALVADAVERETAAAKTEAEELRNQVTSLGNEKDALELRATAAEEKVAEAEKALEDYKTDVETQKAAEAKRDERLTKVAEVAPTLVEGDDEKVAERCNRIVAMDDESFQEYLDSLTAVAPQKANDDGKGGSTTTPPATATPLPRESAAFKGSQPTGDAGKASVKGVFGARRALHSAKSA